MFGFSTLKSRNTRIYSLHDVHCPVLYLIYPFIILDNSHLILDSVGVPVLAYSLKLLRILEETGFRAVNVD